MTEEYIRKQDAVDMCGGYGCLAHLMSTIKPADVVQVVHAHWKDNKNGTVSCSRCSTWFQKERVPYLRFCGYCGARMDGKGEE